jgi:hypothetical protein
MSSISASDAFPYSRLYRIFHVALAGIGLLGIWRHAGGERGGFLVACPGWTEGFSGKCDLSDDFGGTTQSGRGAVPFRKECLRGMRANRSSLEVFAIS